MRGCKEKLAGALVLYKNKDCCEIISAHTTKSMCIAYATEHDKKVCSFYLKLLLIHGLEQRYSNCTPRVIEEFKKNK